MNRTLTLLAVLAAALLTFSACAPKASESSASPASAPDSSQAAPSASVQPAETPPLFGSFTATDLDGNEVNQDIWKDHKLTMVNVWGTFCPPCLGEMPELGELNREYADQGFQVVGIVMDVFNMDGTVSDDQIAAAKEIVEKTHADYLQLIPSDDLISLKLSEIDSIPLTFFVDSEGRVVGKDYLGAGSKEKWKKVIDPLLEELN